MERAAEFIIQKRNYFIAAILIVTIFFGYHASKLKVYTNFGDLLPQKHPYIQLHNRIRNLFGGANQVLIMVQVRKGDIFNVKTLWKVKYLTEQLEKVPGVDSYKIYSIAHSKAKEIRMKSGEMFVAALMFPNIPSTQEELNGLKIKVYSDPKFYGSIVSLDSKKTLITADFFEEEVDYVAIFNAIQKLRKEMLVNRNILTNWFERGLLDSTDFDIKTIAEWYEKGNLDKNSLSQFKEVEKEFYGLEKIRDELKKKEKELTEKEKAGKQVTKQEKDSFESLVSLFKVQELKLVKRLITLISQKGGDNIPLKMEDDNHIINIAGEPMHLGYVKYHSRQVAGVLGLTVLAVCIILYFYFKSKRGVFIPIFNATFSAIWGLGFMGLMGYHLDPLILVLPFLISLMTARHSMQLMARYLEEIGTGKDVRTACKILIEKMFFPGLTSIITDAFGIAIVAIATIPILTVMSLSCAFWSIATVILSLLFAPLLLSYFPTSKRMEAQMEEEERKRAKKNWLDRLLMSLGPWITARGKWVIVGITVVILGVGLVYSVKIQVGDFFPGSSILWPFHRYNLDAFRITFSMPMLNPMYIIVQKDENAPPPTGVQVGDFVAKAPTLREIDKFQRFMGTHERVMFSQSIVNPLPGYFMSSHDNDPNWYCLPKNDMLLSFLYKYLIYQSTSGDWAKYVDRQDTAANVIIYCRDKMPKTVKGVVDKVKEYISKHSTLKGGNFLLAGGAIGTQAAVREVIAESQTLNLILALTGVWFFCALNFRSAVAGLILTIPLAISNVIAFALMGAYNIGLTVNTYPVSSVGIGLGVDYGIYFVGRLLEEMKQVGGLNDAISRTIVSNGRSIWVIATTLTIGLALWIFSPLKFQAEMGILLALLLLMNMLGALLLVPSMISIIKPRFVTKVQGE